MSREIKFRAWHETEKCWYYFTLNDLIRGEAAKDKYRYVNWGRYTGLKDKNGVEIYEGDIVSYGSQVFEIQYDAPGYIMYGDDSYDLAYPSMKNVEVIGNVYENPELLREAA